MAEKAKLSSDAVSKSSDTEDSTTGTEESDKVTREVTNNELRVNNTLHESGPSLPSFSEVCDDEVDRLS